MKPVGKRPKVRPHRAAPRWPSALWRALGVRRGVALIAGLVLIGVLGVGYWFNWGRPAGQRMDLNEPGSDVELLAARVPSDEALKSLKPAFLDKALTAPRIAWLIDGSQGMARYYTDVTTLVATAMALMKQPTQEFGLYLAGGAGSESLRLAPAGKESLNAARSAMRKFRVSGRVDLAPAFAQVAAWRPDEIFLVLSQPTNVATVEEMIRQAKSTNVTVHVAALGEQQYFGWASLAHETRGDFIPLNATRLGQLTERTIRPAASRTEPHPVPGAPSGEGIMSPGIVPREGN